MLTWLLLWLVIIGVISVRGPWLCGLGMRGGEIIVTVTPPLETLLLGIPHLLEPVTIMLLESGGGVGTAEGATGSEFICWDELSLVMLLCRPPTDPPKTEKYFWILKIWNQITSTQKSLLVLLNLVFCQSMYKDILCYLFYFKLLSYFMVSSSSLVPITQHSSVIFQFKVTKINDLKLEHRRIIKFFNEESLKTWWISMK